MVLFLDLNTDCLLKIFSFCCERDLCHLCKVHRFLNEIIENNVFKIKAMDLLMCGIRNEPVILQRTQVSDLSYSSRLKIARNWLDGRYSERQYFRRSKMFPTKLILERNWLYISHANYINQHQRLKSEPLQRRYHREISTSNKSDIAHFVKKNNTLFAGRVAGSGFIYEEGSVMEQQLHNPNEYMWCVDFEGDLYATSSDYYSQIWRREEEFGILHLDLLIQLKSSFKTMQFDCGGTRLYGGLYDSKNERRALREIDVESGYESILNSDTISVYDLKMKDNNIILTANFDSSFRIFDRRSNNDEAVWEDPFDSSFYCLEYDGLYAVLCGTKRHNRVNLYDIRVPGKHMQLYFPHFQGKERGDFRTSPVYSIACDSRYMFVATDRKVHVLDFKVDGCAVSRDYSHFNFIR
ncbi:F-box/WD repeat-containing protein 4 [Stomoxys calcitrans]|uniref:F-box/WD repeat-containing protein 4 n=1 Tax=Stomoxys calcitrans TaxID=35570 RepID=UPI0027E2856C|nr:F-box/WD repeat-containing protein 4 [Stomoxys calcitrans]XP_013119296.2 F-box/WD repeat-containing protein 4 [Stomoxys calcitrans]XP_013119297.2 F-box/WD repeat-containing protein 4 [Stomoxys calcitrans]XP_013119298.2 F-box/WD repeat-containing protein 4 [Stomoxys calcitrans]